MRTVLRSLLVLTLSFGAAFGAVVTGPTALPASAITAAFGAAVGAQALQTTNAISLRSETLTLSSVDQLRASYPTISNPQEKAAATAVLAVLAAAPAERAARLAATDLPTAVAARIVKIAAKIDSAAQKDPAVAAKVAADRKADGAMIARALAHSEKVLPADLVATFKAFMGAAPDAGVAPDIAAPTAVPARTAAATPVAAAPKGITPAIRKSFSANFAALLAKRPNVTFGSASLPIIGMPQIGDTFSDLWAEAHAQSDSLLIAAYNWDDLDMAKSIVAAAKAGKKVVFVGDYSNWFPKSATPNGGHGKEARTDAMNLILANRGPNLQLFILQGLGGTSGINHNKFSVFSRKDKDLAQTGSFNYTKSSQNNHFENFGFTDDADRVKFLKAYHGWLVRRARPFKEGMPAQQPTFPANDPIPVDAGRLTGIPFPKEVGTPKSEAASWFVKFYQQAKKDVFGAMFAMFPTSDEVAAIEAKLAAGIPVNFIVDRGEVAHSASLWGLIQKGMKLRILAGPEEVIYGTTADANHSKLHMKYVGIDGGRAAKGVDSLNDSNNAEQHNFENLGFWEGYIAQFLYTYVSEVMWPLAETPSKDLLLKLETAYKNSQQAAPPAKPTA
jgi:hypothetical protein